MRGFEDFWEYASLGNFALWPLSQLYAAGWDVYAWTYRSGNKKAYKAKVPVLCVGNLRVGGTGKTPVTIALAQLLLSHGNQVVLSLSGYGSPRSEDASLAPAGRLNARDWGDEPATVRDLLPDVPMIVGRNRVSAAKVAEAQFPDAILLLDDGFQHLPLHKTWVLLLDPPSRNPFCMPAGPYRQRKRDRTLADALLPDTVPVTGKAKWFSRPDGSPETLPPQEIQVVSSIARPHRFFLMLSGQGYQLNRIIRKSDHDSLQAPGLLDGLNPLVPLVVTRKDWVKLREREEIERYRVYIADLSIEFDNPEELIESIGKVVPTVKRYKVEQ
ncbi:MAG: tetraacyldisaccharide 4'-kinase [Armatimonadetes bacterium]|nr:tetraacyldisaccharide 4'-kinase [Armatimonadota bacterium]